MGKVAFSVAVAAVLLLSSDATAAPRKRYTVTNRCGAPVQYEVVNRCGAGDPTCSLLNRPAQVVNFPHLPVHSPALGEFGSPFGTCSNGTCQPQPGLFWRRR